MTAGNRPEPLAAVLDRAAQRVVAAVPSVSSALAREFVERSANRVTTRQLDEHLAAHPDALTSGCSAAPLPVQVLAALLAAAGHDGVRVPACLRCGAEKVLRSLVDGGRVCDRCRYLAHRERCADCRRERPVFTRDEQGRPLCESCGRPRKWEHCGQCGVKRRVAGRNEDGSALCPNCDQSRFRTCCRCGRSAPSYANTPDGPTCKACYVRPRRRCGGCGQVSRIDLSATATQPDLCSRCRTRRRRDCLVCGQLHPANPLAVKPVCLACREAGHILEPDLTEPPDRVRRRRHESAHDVVNRRLRDLLTHPERGIAEQLLPLVGVFDRVPNPDWVMQSLIARRGMALLLRELAMRAHTETITHELLDGYRQNYALHRLRDLLALAGILAERTELLDRIEPWLDHRLAGRPQHHGTLVRPFATWHALRRARQRARRRAVTTSSATYVRSQITIALDFLSWLDDRGQTLTTTSQSDLDRWLDDGTQTNRLLAPFITWANARGLCDLTVPGRPRHEPEAALPDQERWSLLRRCLHDPDMPADVRAAGTLVLLYGRSTTSFTDLTVADIQQTGSTTYLRLGNYTAELPPAVAGVFENLRAATTSRETFHRADPRTRFLFPGRSPGQPAAAHVIARKLRGYGINTLDARSSARATWARDVPSPIAADLLGVHITTATGWAGRTRRDWADYLSARADNRTHSDPTAQP